MSVSVERFGGCLLGALAGDCLGAKYEGSGRFRNERQYERFKEEVIKSVQRHCRHTGKAADEDMVGFTDDTAMTKDVCDSLLASAQFDAADMAKRFTETFYLQPMRGYGGNVIDIFSEMRQSNYTRDPVQLASSQFGGSGSYGNGAAMRVAPVSLFFPKDTRAAAELAVAQSQLTHTHPDGVTGAVMQAVAVHLALNAPSQSLEKEPNLFIDKVQSFLREHTAQFYSKGKNPYLDSLDTCKRLLDQDAPMEQVASELGNSVAAARSVPTALYSFVRCLQPVSAIPEQSPLVRTITYAICLAGDTDTIASMAGAIAGAYYGEGTAPRSWLTVLEGAKETCQTSSELHARQ